MSLYITRSQFSSHVVHSSSPSAGAAVAALVRRRVVTPSPLVTGALGGEKYEVRVSSFVDLGKEVRRSYTSIASSPNRTSRTPSHLIYKRDG